MVDFGERHPDLAKTQTGVTPRCCPKVEQQHEYTQTKTLNNITHDQIWPNARRS